MIVPSEGDGLLILFSQQKKRCVTLFSHFVFSKDAVWDLCPHCVAFVSVDARTRIISLANSSHLRLSLSGTVAEKMTTGWRSVNGSEPFSLSEETL